MATLPTLAFVHAHPDDEVFFGAGAARHYASLGYRVVLATFTNGRLGIDPSGKHGAQPGHDEEATKAVRAGELERAASILGFSATTTFGYDDSGMKGWPQNDDPNAFVNCDVDAVATGLLDFFAVEQPSVVVTYDENGFYGHPDHIMANRVTRRALELAEMVDRLYYPVVPASVLTSFKQKAREDGLAMPAWILDAGTAVSDDMVTTTLDVRAVMDAKREAIIAHASQIDNAVLIEMKQDLFTLLFGIEWYQRAWSRTPSAGDATDLFGGLQ